MWLLCDYGSVLSLPQPLEDLDRLRGACGFEELSQFEAAYWEERAAYDRGRLGTPEYWRGVLRRTPSNDELAGLDKLDIESWSHANPDSVAAIEAAGQAGCRLALLSNAPVTLARALERFDWLPRFEHLFFSCDLGLTKPDPRIYEAALVTMRARPCDVTFVDDRLDNVLAAQELGFGTIHFHDPRDLERLRSRTTWKAER